MRKSVPVLKLRIITPNSGGYSQYWGTKRQGLVWDDPQASSQRKRSFTVCLEEIPWFWGLSRIIRISGSFRFCIKTPVCICYLRIRKERRGKSTCLPGTKLIELLELERALYTSRPPYGPTKSYWKTDEKNEKSRSIRRTPDLLDDVIIENKQAIEMANIYSGILSGTMDAFASVISNNLNIVKIPGHHHHCHVDSDHGGCFFTNGTWTQGECRLRTVLRICHCHGIYAGADADRSLTFPKKIWSVTMYEKDAERNFLHFVKFNVGRNSQSDVVLYYPDVWRGSLNGMFAPDLPSGFCRWMQAILHGQIWRIVIRGFIVGQGIEVDFAMYS